ncbi:hypothetical protein IGJ02_000186 [Enterococcus sp. DIV0724b]|uniref:hypothetical protein n=1 Tax=Enterococcus sp. DIV0724b TaxID=2774694 RepID=UPI003D2FCC1E
MKLDASYQSNINYYQRKIDEYNREAQKSSDKQSLTHKTTNVTLLKIELDYYKKQEKKRVQKLALIQECKTVCNEYKPEAKKTKKSLNSDAQNASKKVVAINGKQMIKGKSGKKLEQSLIAVRNSVNTIEFSSNSFS